VAVASSYGGEAIVNIGVPRLDRLFNRVSLPLALLFCLAQARPALWAQDKEWDEHMKAGNKASLSVFHYKKAEKEFQAALARTQAFPPNDLRTAETLSKIAFLYARENKYTEAESRQKQAVAILQASAAPDDPRLACAQIGLALVYEFEGKSEEAAPIWDRYFPILQKLVRPLDPVVSSAMIDLRSELLKYGGGRRQDSDVEAKTTILEIDEKAFGPDSPETGSDARSLGECYEDEGWHGAAYPLLLRSLEISRKTYEKERAVSGVHRDAATALDTIIGIPEVFALLAGSGGGPGPHLDAHWGNLHGLLLQCKELAKVAAKSGKYAEAERLYKQIIPLDLKRAGSNKWDETRGLADDLMDFARVYRHEKRYDDAVDTIKRCEMADERAATAKYAEPEKVSLLHWYSQSELAEIDREKGDLAAARPLFERALEMSGKVPFGYPRFRELLSNYAALLVDEGKLDEAESFYKRALETWGWYPELEHAEALANYAALLRKLNRPTEAEPLEAQASATREKATSSRPVN
jgi:tetratricopeptide (TPR) repeat protein